MKAVVKTSVADRKLVEQRRAQIIKAATELFGERGYHVTTIRDIAELADVSIGLIYQYVEDKEDVLLLTLLEVNEAYHRKVSKALVGLDDPLARFCAAFCAYCEVNDANVDATMIAYRETKSLKQRRRHIIMQREVEANKLLIGCIEACIRAGLFEEDTDIELMTYQIVMFAHAWALKAWRFRPTMTIEDYIKRGLKLILRGCLTERGKRRLEEFGHLNQYAVPSNS